MGQDTQAGAVDSEKDESASKVPDQVTFKAHFPSTVAPLNNNR